MASGNPSIQKPMGWADHTRRSGQWHTVCTTHPMQNTVCIPKTSFQTTLCVSRATTNSFLQLLILFLAFFAQNAGKRACAYASTARIQPKPSILPLYIHLPNPLYSTQGFPMPQSALQPIRSLPYASNGKLQRAFNLPANALYSTRPQSELNLQHAVKQVKKVLENFTESIPPPFITAFEAARDAYLEGFVESYLYEISKNSQTAPEDAIVGMSKFVRLIGSSANFSFSSFHKAVRTPIDYFTMGKEFWRPLIDFDRSVYPSVDKLKAIQEWVKAGDNVLLLSNHQTEPDPQVMHLLFEHLGYPDLSEQLTMVAGHRVRTDPLAIPFSIGCNLLSVHSKKHIDSDPQLKREKLRENFATLKILRELFRSGSQLIWVAPSGGRDRPLREEDECQISAFDNKTVEIYTRLAMESVHSTHIIPMALYTAPICPPPKMVLKHLGERRSCSYSPVGMLIGEPMNNTAVSEALTESAERQTRGLYDQIKQTLFMPSTG